MNDIIKIKHIDNYTYYFEFDNGVKGTLDLEEILQSGPVFSPLREHDFFQKAFLEGGTISWPNGADIAPEYIYGKLAAKQTDTVIQT